MRGLAISAALRPRELGTEISGKQRTAIFAILAATVLVVLDAAIANVALPTIGHSLHVAPAHSVLVVTAYQLALVMALLPCAALGESVGYRNVFTLGVAMFTGASVLCALSPTLPWLIAARFVQGLGGSAVMSLGIALMRQVVPPERLGTAIGWSALTVALSSAAGPAVGSFVLSSLSWPWLFIVNLPVGGIVLMAGRMIPDVAGNGKRLDVVCIAMNGAMFGAFVIGAELLPSRPAIAASLLASSGFALVVLVRRELPRQAPLFPLDLLRSGSFRVSVIASVSCFIGQTAGMLALPFYLQYGLHQSALMTGLIITPWPLTVALTAPIAGRLANRFSGAWLCAAGGTALAVGLAGMAVLPLHGAPIGLVPFVMLCGLGFGLFQVPNNRNMFLSAPKERSAAAGGVQGTARLTGQTIGAVMMTLLFTVAGTSVAPRIGMGIGAILTLTAGLTSILRLPGRGLVRDV
jgi:DHA2 family multidrug resistance protein-like MFS transporter